MKHRPHDGPMGLLSRWMPALMGRDVVMSGGGIMPPSRSLHPGTLLDSVTLPAVYRALDVIATAASQLTIDAERTGNRRPRAAALLRQPCLDLTLSEWITQVVLSIASRGDAFLLVRRGPATETVPQGPVLSLDPLAPDAVHVGLDDDTGVVVYTWNDHKYARGQILHLTKMRLPGRLRGIGPIQAAQANISGALELRDYVSQWFTPSGTGLPSSLLTSDQPITDKDAEIAIRLWNGTKADGTPLARGPNPSRTRVLGKGLAYTPLLLNPADAMWLDAQRYTTLEVARLMGTPSSLMLATPDGSSQTYANVDQEWLGFSRFTLMGYLRPIEEALSDLLPFGTRARFNLEGLLRSDRTTRYQGHQIAISAGFMTVDEVRAIEGMPPLTTGGPDA